MTRDTRTAHRARQKATNDSVSAAVAEMRAIRDAEWEANKVAQKAAESARVKFTRDDLQNAVIVTDRYGTYPVLRVNRDTITVDGDFGPRRIRFDMVHRHVDGVTK